MSKKWIKNCYEYHPVPENKLSLLDLLYHAQQARPNTQFLIVGQMVQFCQYETSREAFEHVPENQGNLFSESFGDDAK